ncbi:MAG: host-nuclease inhibitor Gam family protein [Verrucomicrobiota bacterium]
MIITDIKSLTLALDLAARERIAANSITTEMDAEISAARAKHESKIKKHQDNEAAYLASAKVYSEANRRTLLSKDGKSAMLGAHKIGWQDNGGAVSFAKGKGKGEKGALAAILKVKQLARLFTRQTPSIDKEAIAKKWAVWGEKLRRLGVRYGSTESFFIELDITQPAEARVKPADPAQA